MKIIGLTGSIGSGKSTVSKIIREAGIPVICADEIAHQVVKIGTLAYQQIIQSFGQGVLLPNQEISKSRQIYDQDFFGDLPRPQSGREGEAPQALPVEGATLAPINRKKLGELVFKDKSKRDFLNQIVHPEVIKKMREEIKDHQRNKTPLVFLDIPLLYESGLEKMCDQVVVIYAPESMMMERIKKRDGLDEQEIKNRIASQISIEEKKKKADYVIDNSGNFDQTKKQVQALINKIQQTK